MTVIDTYTLQIVRDEGFRVPMGLVRKSLNAALPEAQENITDLLPQGYRAVIRRWDEPDWPEPPPPPAPVPPEKENRGI